MAALSRSILILTSPFIGTYDNFPPRRNSFLRAGCGVGAGKERKQRKVELEICEELERRGENVDRRLREK